jgi:hypothetical protein
MAQKQKGVADAMIEAQRRAMITASATFGNTA